MPSSARASSSAQLAAAPRRRCGDRGFPPREERVGVMLWWLTTSGSARSRQRVGDDRADRHLVHEAVGATCRDATVVLSTRALPDHRRVESPGEDLATRARGAQHVAGASSVWCPTATGLERRDELMASRPSTRRPARRTRSRRATCARCDSAMSNVGKPSDRPASTSCVAQRRVGDDARPTAVATVAGPWRRADRARRRRGSRAPRSARKRRSGRRWCIASSSGTQNPSCSLEADVHVGRPVVRGQLPARTPARRSHRVLAAERVDEAARQRGSYRCDDDPPTKRQARLQSSQRR